MMLQALAEVLRCRRSEGWLVGGTVRDRQMGRSSPDLDVVVADDPARVAAQLAASVDAPWFPLSARHGAYRVVAPGAQVDVAGMRGGSILDDLALRDFTINAMASPIGDEGQIIDPFDGLRDLKELRLAPVSERIFEDDPLRLLRAARFCHVMKLSFTYRLGTMIREQAEALTRGAPERAMAEMALILAVDDSAGAASLLDELGLLREVIPVGAAENARVLEGLDALLASVPALDDEWIPLLAARLADPVDGVFSRPAALRLAALVRHLPPEQLAKLSRRLKLSGSLASLLAAVASWWSQGEGQTVEEHLGRIAASARDSVLFFWQTEPWAPEVILLAAAEGRGGAHRAMLRTWRRRELGAPALPFDGHTLMIELGLAEGRALGAILREVRLAWEAGEAQSGEAAMELARSLRDAAAVN